MKTPPTRPAAKQPATYKEAKAKAIKTEAPIPRAKRWMPPEEPTEKERRPLPGENALSGFLNPDRWT